MLLNRVNHSKSISIRSKHKRNKGKKKKPRKSSKTSKGSANSTPTAKTPPVLLQRPSSAKPMPSIREAEMQSLREAVERFFPPFFYPVLVKLGGPTIREAHHLQIDDLNESSVLTRVLSRKTFYFL